MNQCAGFSQAPAGPFILLFLLIAFSTGGSGRATVGNSGIFYPEVRRLFRLSPMRFDHDGDLEYLVLYSLRNRFGLIL